jgi:hypothetical protein
VCCVCVCPLLLQFSFSFCVTPQIISSLPGPSRDAVGHVPREEEDGGTGAMDVDDELRMRESK